MVARKLARKDLFRPHWAACALLVIPWVSHSESLADAWAMALQSDGTLAAAHSEREAAEAEHSAALRQRWPSLDLNSISRHRRASYRRRSGGTTAMRRPAPIYRCRFGRRVVPAAPSGLQPPVLEEQPPRR